MAIPMLCPETNTYRSFSSANAVPHTEENKNAKLSNITIKRLFIFTFYYTVLSVIDNAIQCTEFIIDSAAFNYLSLKFNVFGFNNIANFRKIYSNTFLLM